VLFRFPCKELLGIVSAGALSLSAAAQSASTPAETGGTTSVHAQEPSFSLERGLPLNVLKDQAYIWSAPTRIQPKTLVWLVPAGVIVAESLHRDSYVSSRMAGTPAEYVKRSRNISDATLASIGAITATTYIFGHIGRNEHLRETGVLATQAFANSFIVRNVVGQTLRRAGPEQDVNGKFFQPQGNSFPSGHSIYAWSMAAVIAQEYPGWLTKTAVYGLAATTSLARVSGREHSATDVLVGAAIGYGIGRMVYARHHNPELGGAYVSAQTKADEIPRQTSFGSAPIALDHWSYEAFELLSARGLLTTDIRDLRPWTRIEAARLVLEAEAVLQADDASANLLEHRLLRDLRQEFAQELSVLAGDSPNTMARIHEVYTRFTGIGGPALTDGFHFGQTISDDYGRPNREGFNNVTGASASMVYGPWTVYARGEYQRSPGLPPLSPEIRTAISNTDQTPLEPAVATSDVSRMRWLDLYLGYTWRKWQFTFGNQSLWWGPNTEGALNLSNNAAPVTMFRVTNTLPVRIPGPFRWLGPMRVEGFVGALRGHRYIRTSAALFTPPLDRQPLINGAKFAFKPTQNFEFGLSITSVWGGSGAPLNLRTFFRSFSPGNEVFGQPGDPGDRRTGFDFRYRIPGLRRYLTLYNDSMAEDENSPIAYPRRSAMAPGILVSQLPKVRNLTLRVESYYTDLPGLRSIGVWYANGRYLGGYTNNGEILGHWIGRQGLGVTGSARYWFDARRSLDFSYRQTDVNRDFLGGGEAKDISVGGKWGFREWQLSATLQHERWDYPLLNAGQQTNTTVRVGISYSPRKALGLSGRK
jgi:membrane-associated phospholipid phosphatase